jgi:hypothetical protein
MYDQPQKGLKVTGIEPASQHIDYPTKLQVRPHEPIVRCRRPTETRSAVRRLIVPCHTIGPHLRLL